MSRSSDKRDIPRIWEVDWAIPAAEGGTRCEAYGWVLKQADELNVSEVTVLGATYDQLGDLGWAIGQSRAAPLRAGGHQYRENGITVRGETTRGYWRTRGPVLVAWASDAVLAEVESQRPPAIAAVASWPDSIASWRSVYAPDRIGQVRAEQEADYDTFTVTALDPRAARAIDGAAAAVNENHSAFSTDERQFFAGALVALREAGVPVDRDALQAHLMTQNWNGELIARALKLADRVARGETPRHRRFPLD